MKKLLSFLSSMLFTGILLVIFAIAIGYATFIENDYGTITAKILIYNSWWFEVLLIILSLNMIGSIFKYNLIKRKKWTILLFHFSFIIVLIGAALTRYYGYEGTMHIREGGSSSTLVSEANFVRVKVTSGGETKESETEVKFSPYTGNPYSTSIDINGKTIHIENEIFMPSAAENLVVSPNGEPVVSLLTVFNGQRTDFTLRRGDTKSFGDRVIGFEAPNADLQLTMNEGNLLLTANDSVLSSRMNETTPQVIPADSTVIISNQKVYTCGELNFALKQFLSKGITQLVYQQPQRGAPTNDAMKAIITSGNERKELVVYGQNGAVGNWFTTNINGTEVSVSYGAKTIELPFEIQLKDFQLERYPGSMSPSSYASEVVLKDGDFEMPYRIFMNNILNYQGYRFFQSSYDTDEMGTILSVNSDKLGTTVTYIGYLIMVIGMVISLFNKNSRFLRLVKASGKLRNERKKMMAVLVLGIVFSFSAQAQTPAPSALNKDHVREFNSLLVQSRKGRVEPVSTIASEILRKVAKKTSWQGMNPTEVFLDMQANPEYWKNVPIIKIANADIRKMVGASGKYATFNQIVATREMGGYKLLQSVQEAYNKKSNTRNKFDKEVMNVDERVNIMMSVFQGGFLNVFPIPGDANHKWVSINETTDMDADEATFARQTIQAYFAAVAVRDWATSGQLLGRLKQYQENNGSNIIPPTSKVKLEILYNQLNIFGKLSKLFMFTGLILLMLQLVTLFNPKFKMSLLKKLAFYFIFLLFLAETAGLGIRWYISGHAPWSNGYESMIFISWATALGGIIFARRSEITLSLTSVLAGLALLVAGMSWMSPEITNLVPVLQSYWLIVHVAIITASYGFLGISALLGFLNLILMIFKNKNNAARINLTIRELVNIIQIALIIGLLMLTVGSFLGGVWANESWGRYWGWDPKETWALVTILVYTFVTHMHRIPGMRGNFALSAAALVSISSVLMTYFGVNYYLSGLHSYASGEPAPIPSGVYIAIVVVAVVLVAAYMAEKVKPTPAEELEE